MSDLGFDEATTRILQSFNFDRETFTKLRSRLERGDAGPESNRILGEVAPPSQGEVMTFPPVGSPERAALERVGLDAIRAGRVGSLVLAGGMATRFGGVVKAVVEVVDGHTFLDVKLADAAHAGTRAGATVPVYLMTSFATDAEIKQLAAERTTDDQPVETFPQLISVRLTPEGEVFEEDGRPSLYAPGHGDLTFALRQSGVLERFRARGGEILFMSNVDNVAATLDPAVIGAHIEGGAAVTVEVAPKEPGDKGGAPARVDGRVQIVESFRFPDDFDQDRIDVFNTNTLVLDAAAIDRDFDLTWFTVRKRVDDRDAIQFERLVGELTAFLPSRFLRVDREGADGRFTPVKDPDELDRRRDGIRSILTARGIL